MKIGKYLGYVIFTLLFFATTPSFAGGYVSGAISLNDHGYEIDGDSAGYTLGVGYRPTQGGLGGEIDYINTGSANIDGLGDLEMSGANFSIVYWIPNNEPELAYMHGYVKLGIYRMRSSLALSTANSTGWSAGLGFEFRVRPNLGLYADVDGFLLVDATNNLEDNLTIWSFGARYHF